MQRERGSVRWLWDQGCLPGFKDFHLPDMCVPSILVIGQDADLKEECLHWPEQHETLHLCVTDFANPHVPSFFVISMSTHSSGSSNSMTLICCRFNVCICV